MLVLVLLAGCGGDDEEQARQETAPAQTETTATTERAPETETETQSETEAPPETAPAGDGHGGGHETPTSPEQQPGGAGDEEPARSVALLTGRGGRIAPRVVRVPPFISVRVRLHSADGRAYSLQIGDRTLRAGGPLGSSSVALDGLRPGKSYVGTDANGARIRIEASAEPGP